MRSQRGGGGVAPARGGAGVGREEWGKEGKLRWEPLSESQGDDSEQRNAGSALMSLAKSEINLENSPKLPPCDACDGERGVLSTSGLCRVWLSRIEKLQFGKLTSLLCCRWLLSAWPQVHADVVV